jgi:signal transduction histidine kinase
MPLIYPLVQITIPLYLVLFIGLLTVGLIIWGFFRIRRHIKTNKDLLASQKNYQEKNASLDANIQLLREENRMVKAEILNLQEKDKASKKDIQNLQEKNRASKTEIQDLKEEKRNLETSNDRFQEENNELTAENTLIQQKNRELEADLQHFLEERAAKPGDQDSPGNEEYQNFIYHISHEISNPLQSIQTSLDNMAELTPEEKGRWEQYRSLITDEIRRLRDLTTSLRLLSRVETAGIAIAREPVNMKGVVESVILELDEQAAAKGVTLKMQCPARPARVIVNRDQIRQVLINLVDNGIKYSKEKDGEVLIDVQDGGDRLCIRVFDNGIGIPEEDLPHIFDIAYRSPGVVFKGKKGSGLGLAIAKRIIKQHGGTIDAESKPGEGTTITFDLPISGVEANQTPRTRRNKRADVEE